MAIQNDTLCFSPFFLPSTLAPLRPVGTFPFLVNTRLPHAAGTHRALNHTQPVDLLLSFSVATARALPFLPHLRGGFTPQLLSLWSRWPVDLCGRYTRVLLPSSSQRLCVVGFPFPPYGLFLAAIHRHAPISHDKYLPISPFFRGAPRHCPFGPSVFTFIIAAGKGRRT